MTKPDKTWFRVRRYLHFDEPVRREVVEALVQSPERVRKHSFLPFIAYNIETRTSKINKKTGERKKIRPIRYASHIDSHVYAYYSKRLAETYESIIRDTPLNKVVLAFRPLGKTNINFAHEAFLDIHERGSCCAIAMDVSGFFDNLDHAILKNRWATMLGKSRLPDDHYAVFKSLTKYAYIEKSAILTELGISPHNPRKNGRKRLCSPDVFRRKIRDAGLIQVHRVNKGIPQGSPISAILSNIYMTVFDGSCCDLATRLGGSYRRYCDDILFICGNEHKDVAVDDIQRFIQEHKLEINKEKTNVSEFTNCGTDAPPFSVAGVDKPLQYLGFMFDGQRRTIRSSSLAKFARKMKKAVRAAKRAQHKANNIRAKNGLADTLLFKRKLYRRYSYIGKQGFVPYGIRSAETMDSTAIRKQIKPLWKRLRNEIDGNSVDTDFENK